jgi:hypothetical protein
LLQHEPALLVGDAAAPLHELDDLVGRSELQLPRQGCLQVPFEELALPATAALKIHIDPVKLMLRRHESSIGEYKTKLHIFSPAILVPVHQRKCTSKASVFRQLDG